MCACGKGGVGDLLSMYIGRAAVYPGMVSVSGGGVGLESRMTSCYPIKLTGCSSDVFENTSKRKKNFIS